MDPLKHTGTGEGHGDAWSRWLLERRHGGTADGLALALEALRPVRDRVIDNARLTKGDVVLDVGAGDGMIGFAALDHVGAEGRVIFSDISQPLVDRCSEAAESLGLSERCSFLVADAVDLAGVDDESVDAVTLRSVLIYVDDKERAFAEAFRVLRPQGRLSLFEPINSFFLDHAARADDEIVVGITAYRLPGLEAQIAGVKRAAAGMGDQSRSAMLDLDVHRLTSLCTATGFVPYTITLEVEVGSATPMAWDMFLDTAPNPLAPTYRELFAELDAAGRDQLYAALRPLVESGTGVERLAAAYVQAIRPPQ